MPCFIRILNLSTGKYNGQFDIYFNLNYNLGFLSGKTIKEAIQLLDTELKFFYIYSFNANIYSNLKSLKQNLKFYNGNNKIIILELV